MTKLTCGLIGQHISRTRLPAALEIMCQAEGLTLDFTLIDTAERPGFDFAAEATRLREVGWDGVTVTHPWKTQARAYAGSGMQGDLAHLGAANTLTFAPHLAGTNTDYTGFLAAYRASALTRPGRVVILGAGGVAEALAPALKTLGATQITLFDIDPARAKILAKAVGPPAQAISEAEAFADLVATADGLVNATPLGMAEHPGSPLAAESIGPQAWAFDAVYTPTKTAFLEACRAKGLACLTGFDLFRAMAVRSFEAYTGREVDQAAILPLLDQLRPE